MFIGFCRALAEGDPPWKNQFQLVGEPVLRSVKSVHPPTGQMLVFDAVKAATGSCAKAVFTRQKTITDVIKYLVFINSGFVLIFNISNCKCIKQYRNCKLPYQLVQAITNGFCPSPL